MGLLRLRVRISSIECIHGCLNGGLSMESTEYGLMLKTVSEDCNLACDYCYYSRVKGQPQTVRKPSTTVLRRILSDYFQTCGTVASIAWQGGEPLLAGLPFFQQVVAWEVEYAPPGTIISNALQTNGTLLNPEWATFLRQYQFLVGVSVDGPRTIHDCHRVSANGHGSYGRVMRGIDCLRRAGVEFNILTVVGPHNVHRARDLMAFYRQEGFAWVQFIPQMRFASQDVHTPGAFAITPEDYGQFLCEAFDLWYNGGHPDLSVRYFDNVLQTYMNHVPDLCTVQSHCPQFLVIESNGDIYACDFYLDPAWKAGNVMAMPLAEAFHTEAYQRFARLKPSLPSACQTCPWLRHCQGGCPRNRTGDPVQTDTADYFCAAFQQFFAYADERLQQLAQRLRSHRTAPGTLPV